MRRACLWAGCRYGVCESSARCLLLDSQHPDRPVPDIDEDKPEADMGTEVGGPTNTYHNSPGRNAADQMSHVSCRSLTAVVLLGVPPPHR